MVWQFIGVYIINRILHGRLKIRNFSSRVEKIFHSFAALTHIFQHSKRNFVSPRSHVISSISELQCGSYHIRAKHKPVDFLLKDTSVKQTFKMGPAFPFFLFSQNNQRMMVSAENLATVKLTARCRPLSVDKKATLARLVRMVGVTAT